MDVTIAFEMTRDEAATCASGLRFGADMLKHNVSVFSRMEEWKLAEDFERKAQEIYRLADRLDEVLL